MNDHRRESDGHPRIDQAKPMATPEINVAYFKVLSQDDEETVLSVFRKVSCPTGVRYEQADPKSGAWVEKPILEWHDKPDCFDATAIFADEGLRLAERFFRRSRAAVRDDRGTR
jgi:hypothetical protein